LSTINLTQSQLKDIKAFCSLNNIEDTDAFIKLCFDKGYQIEKYGLLGKTGGEQEKRVEIEVIREKRVEIPVEVIKEVEKIVEVVVEKEVIKEVPVEKVVTKIEYISDKSNETELFKKIEQLEKEKQEFSTKTQELEEQARKFSTKMTEMENIFQKEMEKKSEEPDKQKLLQQTLQTLRGQLNLKDEEIKKLKEDIEYLKGMIDKPATYLRSSNLNDNLYK